MYKNKKNVKREIFLGKDLQVALHLKNAQYQLILNQTKSVHLNTEPKSYRISDLNQTFAFSKKSSLFQIKNNLEESSDSNTRKETLNSIKKIFSQRKI